MSEFSSRHIGINNSQKKEILTFLGVENIDELISQTIPENIRLKKSLKLDEAISENELRTRQSNDAAKTLLTRRDKVNKKTDNLLQLSADDSKQKE